MIITSMAYLTASLLAHIYGTTPMTDLRNEHAKFSSIEIKNKYGYASGSLSIQLLDNKWRLCYQYLGSERMDLLEYNKDLELKSALVIQQENESLEGYTARITQQKNDLTEFAKKQIEENLSEGKLPLAGFGAAENLCKALYSTSRLVANEKIGDK